MLQSFAAWQAYFPPADVTHISKQLWSSLVFNKEAQELLNFCVLCAE